MKHLLPFSLLIVVVVCIAVMPWKRRDPNHEFMIEMYGRLQR